MHTKSAHLRMRQGTIFLGGALLYLLLVGGPLGFAWTPLAVGLVYLAAAAAGGRDGGFWPTALVLCGWGLGVLAVRRWGLDVPEGGAVLTGVGLGLLAGELLRRRGFGADPLGAAAAAVAAGVLYMLSVHLDVLLEPATWTLAVGLVGAANLVLAFSRPRGAGTEPGLS